MNCLIMIFPRKINIRPTNSDPIKKKFQDYRIVSHRQSTLGLIEASKIISTHSNKE